jgi:hypothetical protein
MSIVARQAATINPIISALATAFTVSHADDPAALRACQRALEHLASAPVMEFDGVELRVTSKSRGAGHIQIATTESCTCEGAKHPWCLHRIEAILLTAEWALTQPTTLRAKIVEQSEPVVIATQAAPVRHGPMSDAEYAAACKAVNDLC